MTSVLSGLDDREPFETARWKRREAWAFAAMDTMPQIAERVLGIVGEGRIMNKIETYVHDGGLEDLRSLRHATGLHKGGHAAYPEGHNVWTKTDQSGFSVYLTHGHGSNVGTMEGFGIGVMDYEAATEKQVRARYDKAVAEKKQVEEDRKNGISGYAWGIRNVTRIEMHGVAGEPHRTDRIEIEDWNDNGVLRHIVITFVEPDWTDSGRITETNYVILGNYKVADENGRKRYAPPEETEVFARFEGPDVDLDAAREAVREVQARPDVEFAWLAQEQVTRVRQSI